MTVEANIVVRQAQAALLVPLDALQNGSVFVVENGRAVRRAVKIGIRGREQAEVTDGLAAGEVVVLNPPAGLKEGARLRVGR